MTTNKRTNIYADGNNDLVDNFFYPILFRVAKYIPSSIKPNQLTFIAFCFGLISTVSLVEIENKYGLLVSALFIFLWWLFDGLDGIHARNTNQCSMFGAFLDHFFDTLYAGLLFFAVLYHFNLFTPLFVFIALLHLMTQAIFFLSQVYTKVLFLPKLGPSCEAFAMIFIFIWIFFYGATILKFALMSYFITLPYAILSIYLRTLRASREQDVVSNSHISR